MSNYESALIWVVLSVAMSRTYDAGSFVWWFWNTIFLFWALVVVAAVAKDFASWIKERRRV